MKSPQIIIATNASTTNDGDLGRKMAKKQRLWLPTTLAIQGVIIVASSFIIFDERQQLISLLVSIVSFTGYVGRILLNLVVGDGCY